MDRNHACRSQPVALHRCRAASPASPAGRGTHAVPCVGTACTLRRGGGCKRPPASPASSASTRKKSARARDSRSAHAWRCWSSQVDPGRTGNGTDGGCVPRLRGATLSAPAPPPAAAMPPSGLPGSACEASRRYATVQRRPGGRLPTVGSPAAAGGATCGSNVSAAAAASTWVASGAAEPSQTCTVGRAVAGQARQPA